MPRAPRLRPLARARGGGRLTTPGIDAGLLDRFRAAGAAIRWRPVAVAQRSKRGPVPVQRIAHLHDEEARIEERVEPTHRSMLVDSGPVGALVLLLEIDARGPPSTLVTYEAGARPGFDAGALEATWGGPTEGDRPPLSMSDLVGLARYALA